MASALTDFVKKREFLVCMDSDGCVMDTVRIKHCTVFCPELIRVFSLDEYADMITSAWKEINITGITRGIPRFESVVQIFDRLKNRGVEVPGSEDIAAWVRTASELSTASLQQEMLRTGSLALRKLQEWNNACNRRIQALEPTFEPFPGVETSLRQLHAVADVAVVSAANESAIESEWTRYGLSRHADVIFGQEVGSKANSIAVMLACGYESRKVMMVGDAMGDAQAAAANGVAFVPILPGKEAESWRRLQEEALPKLLHGTFNPTYQNELLAALRSALHG
ncbi:HAD hydrolase-like protein [uncultured Gemmiger sp.]|uniref:HAD hydrolase-like protein n=1 Tax=uncultured Gemmiger sp. TaxID=1623490 RepID=UPI0025CD0313|nr:HAD hydrolase-like protein [uncultured Gemmiger sp.]